MPSRLSRSVQKLLLSLSGQTVEPCDYMQTGVGAADGDVLAEGTTERLQKGDTTVAVFAPSIADMPFVGTACDKVGEEGVLFKRGRVPVSEALRRCEGLRQLERRDEVAQAECWG